jgi:hypothetical protein
MGFWSGLAGLFGADFFKSSKPKTDPYAGLMAQLTPYLDAQKKTVEQTTAAGLENTAAARSDYDYVTKYLKDILSGADENVLRLFDTAGLTQNIDENVQQLSEQGVRGGRRAAALSQSYFDRDAAIEKVMQQLRFSAPQQISNIAQAIGNLGLGELSAGQGAGAQASNILFGVEGLKQADQNRRAQLIGSIFQAIGGAAGAIAGGLG